MFKHWLLGNASQGVIKSVLFNDGLLPLVATTRQPTVADKYERLTFLP